MKKIALFLIEAFVVMACEEELIPDVNFAPAGVVIPIAGSGDEAAETVTFDFNANAAWTAALTGEGVDEWLSISPKKGGAGEASIKFTALANPTKDYRTAVLEISVQGHETISVNVSQERPNAIDVTGEASYTVSFEGGSVEIEVGANVDYTYELVDATGNAPEWMLETKAYVTDKIAYTVAPQPINGPARSATLNVYSELGLVKSVAVSQEAWSPIKWTLSLSELGAAAGRVGIAVSGDKVYFTSAGKLYSADEATGENAAEVALPEGFIAGNVLADDAGNILVSGPDRQVLEHPDPDNAQYDLKLYKVTAAGHELLVDYAANNFYVNWMGNFRVKGNVNENATIVAYAAGGTSYYCAWEVVDGVVGSPTNGELPDMSWNTNAGVVAPAGASLADGLYNISYGSTYDLYYFNGESWKMIWESPASWMENFNCISTAEVNGVKYLALTMSCFFDYDATDLVVLDVTNPDATTLVFKLQINKYHGAGEFAFSDVFIKAEGNDLAAYVVDSWMDTVDKYLFPLQ